VKIICVTVNKASLVVDYNTLAESAQALALFLPEAPTEMLHIFDEVFSLYQSLFLETWEVVTPTSR